MASNNAIPTFVLGQLVTIQALFVNQTNTPTNPTTVTFITNDPAGAQITKASPDATITNPSTGTFLYTPAAAVALAGTWTWRVKGVGAVINADEGSFFVEPSLVATP